VNAKEHKAAANSLFKAEQSCTQTGLLSLQYKDMSMDDAYAVQSALVDLKIADGLEVRGYKIAVGRFIQPRIEAEIAFVFKQDLTGNNITLFDVLNATDYISPALEILDTRILRVDPDTVGAGVLNHPAQGIVWLANRLAQYDQTIKKGQVVISGSFIRPIEAMHGSTISADFGPLGTVSVFFE